MKQIEQSRAPELAPLYDLPEFADGLRALAAAAEPRPGLEGRVLARLDAERCLKRPARLGVARGWSLGLAAALLLCAFFGGRVVGRQTLRPATPANAAAARAPYVPGGSEASSLRTADAQRTPVAPVAVGGRLGRATRLNHEQRARDLAPRKTLGSR